jgi:hypothetical protein
MARRQADRMEAKGTIFHNTNLGGEITSLGVSWARIGENVGMGPNVDLIYAALLKSPKHYENIVRSEYNALGMGVVNGDDGKKYLVQVFGNIKGSPAPAPAAAAPAPATAQPVAAAPAAPSTPAAPAPASAAPAPKPAATPDLPAPTADPNALTSGFVSDFELPRSDQGKYLASASSDGSSSIGRLIDLLAFWA